MDNESETQVDFSGRERKAPERRYVRLHNEKDLNTIVCIFCDKVTREASIDTSNILLWI